VSSTPQGGDKPPPLLWSPTVLARNPTRLEAPVLTTCEAPHSYFMPLLIVTRSKNLHTPIMLDIHSELGPVNDSDWDMRHL
jgi:hypothetical protein